jgi:hypothetical protein
MAVVPSVIAALGEGAGHGGDQQGQGSGGNQKAFHGDLLSRWRKGYAGACEPELNALRPK